MQYGDIRGLVFGNYAEVSRDVHDTVDLFARKVAAARWRGMGCQTEDEAYPIVVARMRRRLGALVARAFARHRLRRLPLVGLTKQAMERAVARGAVPLAGAPVGDGFGDLGELLLDAMHYQQHPAHAAARR